MQDSHHETAAGGIITSPSIARRKRGRPLRSQTGQVNFGSPSASPVHGDDAIDPSLQDARQAASGRGRSRLGQSVHLPYTRSQSAAITAHDEDQSMHSTTEESEQQRQQEQAAADQYLLTHLAQHVNAGLSGLLPQRPLGMDTFADFLPAGENGDGSTMGAGFEGEEDEGEALVEIEQAAAEPKTSVLSRLKKGPTGSCDICGRTETTVWRKLTLGGEHHKVCNGEYGSASHVCR
jgi:hypothetical protein